MILQNSKRQAVLVASQTESGTLQIGSGYKFAL